MSILVDILLLSVAIANVILFTKTGFLQSVFKYGRKIIAIILTFTLGPLVGKLLYKAFVYGWIYGWVEPKVADGVNSVNELPFLVRQFFSGNVDWTATTDKISETIASPVAGVISNVFGYILVFVVSLLLLMLIPPFLDLITKLPIVNGVNTFFSIVLGLIASFFLLALITLLLGVIIKLFAGNSSFAKIVFDSWIIKFFNSVILFF